MAALGARRKFKMVERGLAKVVLAAGTASSRDRIERWTFLNSTSTAWRMMTNSGWRRNRIQAMSEDHNRLILSKR